MILSYKETIDADNGDEIFVKMFNLSRNNSVIKYEKRI
jgi:dUTPase